MTRFLVRFAANDNKVYVNTLDEAYEIVKKVSAENISEWHIMELWYVKQLFQSNESFPQHVTLLIKVAYTDKGDFLEIQSIRS